MKKVVIVVIAVLWLAFSVGASDKVIMEKDKAAVEKAALDYIEGWYSGDPARMDRALSPDLTKKGIRQERKTGQTIFSYATKNSMMAYTVAGYGKAIPQEKWGIKVEVLDIYADIAMVKALSAQFMDYLQLARNNKGEWKIVNVLWTPNRDLPPPPPPKPSMKKKKF